MATMAKKVFLKIYLFRLNKKDILFWHEFSTLLREVKVCQP